MEKVIVLRPASSADDIHCADGELELSPSRLSLADAEPVPDGAVWLAMHRPSGVAKAHPVFVDRSMLVSSPLPLKGVTVGDWLVVLNAGMLLFAKFSGIEGKPAYTWYGMCPGAPSVEFKAVPRALPPFSSVDGQLPRLSVAVAAGADLNAAVQEAKNRFLDAVKEAGLHFNPVRAAACWRLSDGGLWQLSSPVTVGDTTEVSLRTVSSDYHDGITYLTLEVSRAPFAVEMVSTPAVPASWSGLIDGVEPFVVAEGEGFPEVAEAPRKAEDIFSLEDRLFIVSGDRVIPSLPAIPHVLAPPPYSLLPTNYSLLPNHGTHLLEPSEDGYRVVRHLSGHVPVGPRAVAPLPDGFAFLTEQGVVKVSGNPVKRVPDEEVLYLGRISADAVLIYLYGADRLVVCPPEVSESHYAWPECWIRIGNEVGRAVLDTPGDGELVAIATRPLKLSDAFSLKRLVEVHARWADGSRHPLRVYGAMRLGKWHNLGLSPTGRMRLMGSEWRYFRVETVAVGAPDGTRLPQLSLRW